MCSNTTSAWWRLGGGTIYGSGAPRCCGRCHIWPNRLAHYRMAVLLSARLEDSDVPALLLQRVGRFRIHGLLEPDYLYAFLNSTAFLSRITGHDQSLGVPHVSPSQIHAVDLPLPPPSEQKRMADVFGRHTIKADCVCEAVENELAAINALPAALLRRAFSGAL